MFISPVYVYQCPDCDKVWNLEFAPGFGGPHCPGCGEQTNNIIAKNYAHGTIK